jgi:hypothetical protein
MVQNISGPKMKNHGFLPSPPFLEGHDYSMDCICGNFEGMETVVIGKDRSKALASYFVFPLPGYVTSFTTINIFETQCFLL